MRFVNIQHGGIPSVLCWKVRNFIYFSSLLTVKKSSQNAGNKIML